MVDIAAMVDTAAAIVMADGEGPASDWVLVLRQAQSSAAHLRRRTITILRYSYAPAPRVYYGAPDELGCLLHAAV